MLVAKATRVWLWLADSNEDLAPRHPMLHDETGKEWPYTSVLFASYAKRGGDLEAARDDKLAIKYLGVRPKAGLVDLPPESLKTWRFISEVRAIDYTRPGGDSAISNSFLDFLSIYKRPARSLRGDYEHEFKGGWLIFKTGLPALYSRIHNSSRVYRLEFPPWSKINWRGFCKP